MPKGVYDHWKIRGRGRKVTGQALKNVQEANRKRTGKSYEIIMGSKEKADERKIKHSQTMKNKYENGYSGNKGKNWKLLGQALKNRQELNIKTGMKRRGISYEEIMGSKEKADERKRKISEYMIGKHYKLIGQSLKNIQEAARKPERNRKIKQTKKSRYPIIHDNISFTSTDEFNGYKWLENLHILFKYQFYVKGSSRIDFGILNPITKKPELFWELHNDNNGIYYQERRKLLDDNGYTDVLLIVTYDLSEEAKNKITEMIR